MIIRLGSTLHSYDSAIRIPKAESVNWVEKLQNVIRDNNEVLIFPVEIMDTTKPTRNGVRYPQEAMKKAIEDPRIQNMLTCGSLYGEAEHPIQKDKNGDLDIDRWVLIDPNNTHHKWRKFWFEGTKLMGEVQTTFENGNLLAKRIAQGEIPSFSVRVLGKPKMENGYEVMEDIYIITIDYVGYPGNPTSTVSSAELINSMPVSEIHKVIDAPMHSNSMRAESAELVSYLGTGKVLTRLSSDAFKVDDMVTKAEYLDILKLKEDLFKL